MAVRIKHVCLWREPSPRLRQVFTLVGRGLTDREVGQRLGIGLGTVRTYLAKLRIILPVSTLPEVRQLARDWSAGKVRFYVEIWR
jgi:DNA-binding NarL/FixJ family response regulator